MSPLLLDSILPTVGRPESWWKYKWAKELKEEIVVSPILAQRGVESLVLRLVAVGASSCRQTFVGSEDAKPTLFLCMATRDN